MNYDNEISLSEIEISLNGEVTKHPPSIDGFLLKEKYNNLVSNLPNRDVWKEIPLSEEETQIERIQFKMIHGSDYILLRTVPGYLDSCS